MDEYIDIQAQADKLRAHNVFGRTGALLRLFEFLLQESLAGRRPKEVEIAMEVFGKGTDFDMAQDASVRVYIHKLRRKLDEYYDGPGSNEPARVLIPKGEYRLALQPVPQRRPLDEQAAAPPPPVAVKKKRKWIVAVLALSLFVNAVLLFSRYMATPDDVEHIAVRTNPVWSSLLDDDFPICIVVGNYYIFGETDSDKEVRRLIREFNINSSADLQELQYLHPESSDQYVNLDLSYLPIASAYALRDVVPILTSRKKRVQIFVASDVTAQMLKSAHVVYIGYLSGMGMLQDLAFANSRFSVGETYDEIVDHQSKHNYISQGGSPLDSDQLYHDYGYISSFVGPNGNQFLIIAGTRDVAVMHMAEVLVEAGKLRDLAKATSMKPGFEALYEVSGMNRTDMNGRLISASPLPDAGADQAAPAAEPTRSRTATSTSNDEKAPH